MVSGHGVEDGHVRGTVRTKRVLPPRSPVEQADGPTPSRPARANQGPRAKA